MNRTFVINYNRLLKVIGLCIILFPFIQQRTYTEMNPVIGYFYRYASIAVSVIILLFAVNNRSYLKGKNLVEDFATYADKNGLIEWLSGFEKKPEIVIVNHGDPEAAEAFTDCLNRELGYRAFAPYSGAEFDVLAGRWTAFPEGEPIDHGTPSVRQRKTSPAFTELIAAAEQLLKTAGTLEGHANKELRSYTESIRRLIAKMER